MNKGESISLLELLFEGQLITNFFIVLIIFLGIIFLYLFLLKYFSLKEIYNKEDDFFDNIADCLYDHRIDSAMDMCKRIASPESRIIKKGLDKMASSPFERFIAITNQREIEILKIRKNLFRFGLLSKIIFLLGVVGTGVSLISFFLNHEIDFKSILFYNSFLPLSIGALIGMIVNIQQMVLVSLVSKIDIYLKYKSNKFLEIVEENK